MGICFPFYFYAFLPALRYPKPQVRPVATYLRVQYRLNPAGKPCGKFPVRLPVLYQETAGLFPFSCGTKDGRPRRGGDGLFRYVHVGQLGILTRYTSFVTGSKENRNITIHKSKLCPAMLLLKSFYYNSSFIRSISSMLGIIHSFFLIWSIKYLSNSIW